MGTLLVMIGAWFMLNAFLVVAAINDKLHSWVSYLSQQCGELFLEPKFHC